MVGSATTLGTCALLRNTAFYSFVRFVDLFLMNVKKSKEITILIQQLHFIVTKEKVIRLPFKDKGNEIFLPKEICSDVHIW